MPVALEFKDHVVVQARQSGSYQRERFVVRSKILATERPLVLEVTGDCSTTRGGITSVISLERDDQSNGVLIVRHQPIKGPLPEGFPPHSKFPVDLRGQTIEFRLADGTEVRAIPGEIPAFRQAISRSQLRG